MAKNGKEWRWFVLHLVPAVLLPVTLTTQNKHQQLSGYTAVVKTTALAFLQHTSIAERHTYTVTGHIHHLPEYCKSGDDCELPTGKL